VAGIKLVFSIVSFCCLIPSGDLEIRKSSDNQIENMLELAGTGF